MTTMTAGAHAIKFGAWLRDNREATYQRGASTAASAFPQSTAFVDHMERRRRRPDLRADCRGMPDRLRKAAACPTSLSYTTGNEVFRATSLTARSFSRTTGRSIQFLTLSGGLRWETQNHIADHSDWGPRFAFAYALDGHKKGTGPRPSARRLRILL